MGHWLYRNIVEPGKLPLLLALASFVLTFLVTRTITRLIRAGKGPFRNITPGGVHIHHVVPGVVLTVDRRLRGGRPAAGTASAPAVCAVHLRDRRGPRPGRVRADPASRRRLLDRGRAARAWRWSCSPRPWSLLVLGGFSPFGVNELTADERAGPRPVIADAGRSTSSSSLIALVKGKARMALIGVLVPFVALFGAIRLARPGSPWARRFYRNRPEARARARLRAYRHDRRWAAPRRKFQDLIGGAPDRLTRCANLTPGCRRWRSAASPHSTSTAAIAARCSLPARLFLTQHLDDHRHDHQRRR